MICGYSDPFQPGTFWGSSEVDLSLSQTRIEFENVVNSNLVTIGTFYKQTLPLFQETMNSFNKGIVWWTLQNDEKSKYEVYYWKGHKLGIW